MTKLWFGSLVMTLAVSTAAFAADNVVRIFTCDFKNTKGQPISVHLETNGDSAADLIMGPPNPNNNEVEPMLAWYKLDRGVISVWTKLKVKHPGQGRTLPREQEEPVLVFELEWIDRKDSKKWLLHSDDPSVAGLRHPPVCHEVTQ